MNQEVYAQEACGIDRLGFSFDEVAVGGKPKAIAVSQDGAAVFSVLDRS